MHMYYMSLVCKTLVYSVNLKSLVDSIYNMN